MVLYYPIILFLSTFILTSAAAPVRSLFGTYRWRYSLTDPRSDFRCLCGDVSRFRAQSSDQGSVL